MVSMVKFDIDPFDVETKIYLEISYIVDLLGIFRLKLASKKEPICLPKVVGFTQLSAVLIFQMSIAHQMAYKTKRTSKLYRDGV